MLADRPDYVVGVDTHVDSHTAAVVAAATGVVGGRITVTADRAGYGRLVRFAGRCARGRRVWAVEGTGSYGAGLAAFLADRGERVVEVDRPKRPARRDGAKSDELDAIRAAQETLSREHHAVPRRRGEREALRVLLATRESAVRSKTKAIELLKSLLISAPDSLREELRHGTTTQQLARCSRLRTNPSHSVERACTTIALRSTARRVLALQQEAAEMEREIAAIVGEASPQLLAEFGVGSITAAHILTAYSHRGRFRSEAAFASLAGTAPIPASSGQTERHRLNRGGDRQLNRALHTIVLVRMRDHPQTRAYIARRTTEGLSTREIHRCLKRYTARHIYRLLQADQITTTRP